MTFSLRSAIALTSALVGNPFAISSDPEQPEVEGHHAIVAIERDGKPFDETQYRGATFKFAAGKVVGTNPDGSKFMAADFLLNPIRRPCTIAIKLSEGPSAGLELRGMIDRKGDTIRLILANAGADRPTDFRTRLNQTMFTMKVGQ
jgi:uncharacterized protein (TIGR03067 family)